MYVFDYPLWLSTSSADLFVPGVVSSSSAFFSLVEVPVVVISFLDEEAPCLLFLRLLSERVGFHSLVAMFGVDLSNVYIFALCLQPLLR